MHKKLSEVKSNQFLENLHIIVYYYIINIVLLYYYCKRFLCNIDYHDDMHFPALLSKFIV